MENSLPLRYAERTGSDDAPARMNLILSCTARSGIIAATTRVMADLDCNILESGQYIDEADNRFFMRLSFRAPAGASKDRLETGLGRVAEQFGMTTELRPAGRRSRMIVMVSRFDHSLVHLLYQIRVGWLAADVVAIVSNHEDARETAEMYGIPYHFWPITPASKTEQEGKLRDLYASSGAELIVLARYMQVLSDDFSSPLFGRIINIHHSFLPSFKGDGVDAPRRHRCAKVEVLNTPLEEASMSEVTTIGLDIAKNVFHAHGADASGRALFSRKISRTKLLEFFARQPRCMVALEACGGAHHWARQLTLLGHDVKLIPPAYVKPFVKRNKNDAVDAEAICEAAQRPSMRFVAIKSEAQQASALVFRTRDLLVRQRTQLINAIRGHLTEYGWIAPKGPSHIALLSDMLEGEMGSSLPEAARPMFRTMLDLLDQLNAKIGELDKEIARRAREDTIARRLMTIPGVGPITATAIAALAPPAETFAKGRDFAAWLGLVPRQLSTGGKQKLGSISKMGERTLRRLLIIGCSAVVLQASKRGAPAGSWLEQMMGRKPRMLVTVALANKTARIIWALLMKQEDYKAPVAAAA